MLMTFLTTSEASSQSILVSSETSDTTICFTIPQSRFLLKQHFRWEECDQLLGISEQTVNVLHNTVAIKDETISTQEQIIVNLQKQIRFKDGEISRLNLANEKCNVEVLRQKSQKVWFVLGGGLIGLMAGFYLR